MQRLLLILSIFSFILPAKAEVPPTPDNSISFTYSVKPWYKYGLGGAAAREVVLYFNKQKPVGKITIDIEWSGSNTQTALNAKQPLDSLSVLLPENAGVTACTVDLLLTAGNTRIKEKLSIPEKRQWTVFIYPHSHVDIGYTNKQEIVEKLHVRNIDVAIDIARKTNAYPEGARFVWNPEAAWVVSSYLKSATKEQLQNFKDAVKKGWIQIDGAHSNINTSTCSDEEILQMFADKNAIEKVTGMPITTMVQVDNPGASWGLITAAAANGIKGFFSFPNYFDLRSQWENKPFYWIGPNGRDRLFFLQATSYGYGFRVKGRKYGLGKIQALTDEYDRLSTSDPLQDFIDPFIFEETEKLERQQSPYDFYVMTWSMADNCLIDADLPEAVKLWNQQYAYPKLVIAGTQDVLKAYEEKYQNIIPEVKGDFTEFWTQGLASKADVVGVGRQAKEDLVQAQTLWTMINPKLPAPVATYRNVWDKLLLSAEHTWGYQDPKAPLAKVIEEKKYSYFTDAGSESMQLIDTALQSIPGDNDKGFTIINTLSWQRHGIVTLDSTASIGVNAVVNEKGQRVLSQRLKSGELVFKTDTIAAMGAAYYKLVKVKNKPVASMVRKDNGLQNELLSVSVDSRSGNIQNLVTLNDSHEYVDSSSSFSLNSYNYLPGVLNGRPEMKPGAITTATNSTVRVVEDGPLVASVIVRSDAESCNWLTREIRVFRGEPYIEIVNTIDKIETRKKEGIHYGFAFNVPSGKIHMDIPLGIMRPEADQIEGSNKNWFAFQRWIDVSNNDRGVTWTAIEAPIVELGGVTGIVLDGARLRNAWETAVPETQTILSWPVNNHWNTNFPLQQGGIITQKYFVQPHKNGFDPVAANRFGVERNRPLIVVAGKKNSAVSAPVAIDNPRVMISVLKNSSDGKAMLVGLRSLSGKEEKVNIQCKGLPNALVYASNTKEDRSGAPNDRITLLPYDYSLFRIEFN